MIPFLAAASVILAGMVWMFRVWPRLREVGEAAEGKAVKDREVEG